MLVIWHLSLPIPGVSLTCGAEALRHATVFGRTLLHMHSMNFELCTRGVSCTTVHGSTAVLAWVSNVLLLATTVTTRRGIGSFLGLCPFRPRKLCQVCSGLCAHDTVYTYKSHYQAPPTVYLGWSLAYARRCATLL